MRSARTLVALAVLCLLAAGALMVPTIAKRSGTPDDNIEMANCNCHSSVASDSIDVTIDGDDRAVAGGTARYAVHIARGTAGAQYGFSADLDPKDKDDKDALKGARLSADVDAAPSEGNTHLQHTHPLDSAWFNITLQAPTKAGEITLTVVGMLTNGDGDSVGDQWTSAKKRIQIMSDREANISVEVRNTGGVEARDVEVQFYYDVVQAANYIGNNSIPSIKPGQSVNASIDWNTSLITAGAYRIIVIVDARDSLVELNNGNNRLERDVTIEPRPEELVKSPLEPEGVRRNILIAIIITVVTGVIVAIPIYARR